MSELLNMIRRTVTLIKKMPINNWLMPCFIYRFILSILLIAIFSAITYVDLAYINKEEWFDIWVYIKASAPWAKQTMTVSFGLLAVLYLRSGVIMEESPVYYFFRHPKLSDIAAFTFVVILMRFLPTMYFAESVHSMGEMGFLANIFSSILLLLIQGIEIVFTIILFVLLGVRNEKWSKVLSRSAIALILVFIIHFTPEFLSLELFKFIPISFYENMGFKVILMVAGYILLALEIPLVIGVLIFTFFPFYGNADDSSEINLKRKSLNNDIDDSLA